MTTIAWDGTTLAGDMQAVSNNLKRQVIKLWSLTDGRLYGASGEYQGVLAVKAWLENGEPDDKKPKLDDFAAIVIDHECHCFRLEEQLIYMPIMERYHAVGTGRDFALAAMALGADARMAVSVAAQLDVYTGQQVMAVKLEAAVGDPLEGLTQEAQESIPGDTGVSRRKKAETSYG